MKARKNLFLSMHMSGRLKRKVKWIQLKWNTKMVVGQAILNGAIYTFDIVVWFQLALLDSE